MDPNISRVLADDEKICAKTSGNVEMGSMGGVVYPFNAVILATDKRLLCFMKADDEVYLDSEFSYNEITMIESYRDFFNNTFGICKTLHIQNKDGDLIRLIAPDESEDFVAFVKSKIIS